MKKKMSLSMKLTIVMILLVAGIIGLCWGLNYCFLEPFYIYEKQQSLMETYEILYEASDDKLLTEEDFDVKFERLYLNGNLNILIIDGDSNVIRASMREVDLLVKQMQETVFGGIIGESGQAEVLLDTEDYLLMRQSDRRLQSEYLVLFGNLEGAYVYMRTPLESIRESVSLTNRFFLIVGALGILVGILVIFFVARSVSRPMKELTDISKSMTDLRFEVKYVPKQADTKEVGELGSHMNFMSDTLEKTISDLKKANVELQKDIEKKEEIDEMRKEFLANVSHELKTPIALIQGYAEGLKENITEDEETRDYYCEVIMDEASKMNQMVKKLMSLNQLEFGNDVVEMERFNITEMAAGLVQANTLLAEQKDVQICFEETQPVYVWGDEFKVEEVLTNYISNALHHVNEEKQIEISFEMKEERLRVKVFNTGEPIPEEDLDKIWIKFYKVDKARTREYGGSGIGLSIVKAIMESMNQDYGVRNLKNGVEFWFELG